MEHGIALITDSTCAIPDELLFCQVDFPVHVVNSKGRTLSLGWQVLGA